MSGSSKAATRVDRAKSELSLRGADADTATVEYAANGRYSVSAAQRAAGLRIDVSLRGAHSDVAAADTAIALPEAVREVEIRVVASQGNRELVERVRIDRAASDGAASAVVTVPSGWLTPDTYRVEIRAGADLLAAPLELIVPRE